MKNQLSSEATGYLNRLYFELVPWTNRLLGGWSQPIDLLKKIEAGMQPSQVTSLIPYIFEHNDASGVAAAIIVQAQLESLSPAAWMRLEEEIRAERLYAADPWGWNKLKPLNVNYMERLQGCIVSVLGICSFHPNGYVRQRAVELLTGSRNGAELPFLLIRLNDWVPNVREAAQKAVNERLQPDCAAHFVACLPLIGRLSKRGRITQSSLLDSIQELLRDAASQPALETGLASTDDQVRRICYPIALNSGHMDRVHLLESGSHDRSVIIRMVCLQYLAQWTAAPDFDRLLMPFRTDPAMPIRREALRIHIRRHPDEAAETLKQALLDRHSFIRVEAQRQLAQIEKMDLAAFYREALSNGKALEAAIGGLEETGSAADAALVEPYAAHPLARVRMATIKTLTRLNPVPHSELLYRLLFDPSARVSRLAGLALERNRYFVNPARLRQDLQTAAQSHIKINLVTLMAHLSKWDAIICLLDAAGSPDQQTSSRAAQMIEKWLLRYNTSYTLPNTAQKAELIGLLEKNGGGLAHSLHRELAAIAQSI